MKKLFSLLLIVLMALSLVACTKKTTDDTTPTTDGQSDGVAFKVGFVTDVGGIDDKSFNQTTYEGLKKFGDENGLVEGVNYKYLQSNTDADYVPNLTAFCEENVALIAAAGYLFQDAIETVLAQYPEQQALIIDVDWIDTAKYPNLKQVSFAVEQGSYLVGVAAGLKAIENGSNHVGMILGNEAGSMDPFYAGYQQGVWSVCPECQIDYDCSFDFASAEKGKALATKQYDNGATVIFACAGGTGNGVMAEAASRRLNGEDVWVIGVDTDQYDYGKYGDNGESCVLTSMMKRVDVAMYDAAKEAFDNTFKGGVYNYDLAKEGVGIPKTNPNLDDDTVTLINLAAASIASGETKVSKDAVYGDTDARVTGTYGATN